MFKPRALSHFNQGSCAFHLLAYRCNLQERVREWKKKLVNTTNSHNPTLCTSLFGFCLIDHWRPKLPTVQGTAWNAQKWTVKKHRGWEVFIQNFSGDKYTTLIICALNFNIQSGNYSPTFIYHSFTTHWAEWNWGDVVTQMGCIQKY